MAQTVNDLAKECPKPSKPLTTVRGLEDGVCQHLLENREDQAWAPKHGHGVNVAFLPAVVCKSLEDAGPVGSNQAPVTFPL